MNLPRPRYPSPAYRGVIVCCLITSSSSLVRPASAEPNDRPYVDLSTLQNRVARLTERVTELAGESDLLDSLHFGWFDRPYDRATLAILVKTTHVLQHEMALRRHDNGAITDADLRIILAWADRSLRRVTGPPSDTGFRPDRLRVTGPDLVQAAPTPALFAFVDRATATRCHRSFGDLDLLAAAGSKIYARLDRDFPGGEIEHTLVDRAHGLGMATVVTIDQAPIAAPRYDAARAESSSPGRHALHVVPMTLRALCERATSLHYASGQTAALVDPPFGESWASSIARRALARGVLIRTRFLADGWSPPSVRAVEGQSLGLVRGWRDLRDGSGSPYPSILTDPPAIEAITHTALDLVRLGRHLTPFRRGPSLAIALGDDAVDPQDDNAWAPWIKPIWAELLNRQIRFDVVTTGMNEDQLRGRYPSVLWLRPDDTDDIASVFLRLDRMLAKDPEQAARLKVREANGGPASEVFVRSARTPQGQPCMAVVNLSDRTRRLRFDDGPRLGPMRDLITDTPVRNPRQELVLQPWQTRLLWSGD